MSRDIGQLDEQIERLRGGGTLSENEVRALCETVSWATSTSVSTVSFISLHVEANFLASAFH
jgi:hypothetical protein